MSNVVLSCASSIEENKQSFGMTSNDLEARITSARTKESDHPYD